jgi:periplasmic protein CpxP/Spy
MKTRNVLVLCTAVFVGAATIAAAEPLAPPRSAPALMLAQATPTPATTKPAPAHTSKAATVDASEARIADLHAKLKITPAQEALWSSVTEVMRGNAKTMEPLRKARSEKALTMTAVEDFTSYAEIADVHADGIKKFVPVFAALYGSMSDTQKKNADTMFRRVEASKKGSR